ncbi:hypothetical protein [Leptospira kanakyensis]|uniref:hypothetical protein n=1 Tax=Leptospira kanakyensis TaxID=2484968 RepID=UPI00223DA35D|nr:hypothetical protein [Leptospira kanakyensis]MCW7483287.1 hypothetical protein [Leptospira kanakyensis]
MFKEINTINYLIYFIITIFILNCDIEITKKENEKRCREYLLIGLLSSGNSENSANEKEELKESNLIFYGACITGRRPFGGTIQDSLKESTRL